MLGRIARFLYRRLIDTPRDHDRQPHLGEMALEPPKQETAALQQRVRQPEEMILAQQALYLQQVLVGPHHVESRAGPGVPSVCSRVVDARHADWH